MELMPYIIALMFGVCLVIILITMRLVYRKLPKVGKALEPRPPALRLVMPLVAIVTRFLGSYLTVDYLESVSDKLRRVGVETILTAEEFIGLRVVTGGFGLLMAWMTVAMLKPERPQVSWLIMLALAALGFFYPVIWLNDRRKRQVNEIMKTLPTYLDYLTLAVEAGLNLSGAIDQAVDKGPDGALKAEFRKVLRGLTRGEALQALSDRLQINSMRSVISAIVQAERMGARLGPALRILAGQRRLERFQRAEKLAMEAPVKLLMPLIAFIFPVTFIILMFPIVMKFMQEGLL